MKGLKNKWALVTGASSGFGVEFAKLLAAQGANLVLVARQSESMTTLAKDLKSQYAIETIVEEMDVARLGASVDLKKRLDARDIFVSVLINNAGIGMFGQFVEQDPHDVTSMLTLDILTLTELTNIFAREMVSRHEGHILLVASLTAYQPTPLYAAYGAAKAYVLHFGEALHVELQPFNVVVSVLSPGHTATNFLSSAGQETNWFVRAVLSQPKPVAEIGLKALWNGRSSVVAGTVNKLLAFSTRTMPRSLQARVAAFTLK